MRNLPYLDLAGRQAQLAPPPTEKNLIILVWDFIFLSARGSLAPLALTPNFFLKQKKTWRAIHSPRLVFFTVALLSDFFRAPGHALNTTKTNSH
jgi:hypothetical protein